MIQSSSEPIYIYDAENLKFYDVSEGALRLYNYSRRQFLEMDLTDLYTPEDIQLLIETTDQRGQSLDLKGPVRHRKKDGSLIFVEISKSEFEYNERKFYLNVVKDVTDTLVSNKEHQLFKAAFNYTSDLIFETDKEGIIVDINSSASSMLGYLDEDIAGNTIISLVDDGDRARLNTTVFKSNMEGNAYLKLQLKNNENELIPCQLIANPIKNLYEEIEGYTLIFKVDQHKTSAREIPVKHETKRQNGGIDSSFLSHFFHELLTPINVIIGFGQELKESIANPTDEQQEAIDIIQENQRVLVQLIDSASEYASFQEGNIIVTPSKVVFVDLLDEIEKNFARQIQARNIEIKYGKISSSLSFETDKNKLITLLTIILNFCINIAKSNYLYISAFHYTEDSFVIGIKNGKTSISEDFGKILNIILTEEEEYIRHNYGFSRFSIRLYRSLLEMLRIKPQIISRDNNITEYGFIIPFRFAVETEEEVVREEVIEEEIFDIEESPAPIEAEEAVQSEPAVMEEPAQAKIADISGLACLYIEDQIDSQILFKSQMKEFKEISFAFSLEGALPLLGQHAYDLILTDINLQGSFNGIDVLRTIQKIPEYQNTPIIAVTAYALPGDKENFIKAGFRDFITKPLLRDKLIESIRHIF